MRPGLGKRVLPSLTVLALALLPFAGLGGTAQAAEKPGKFHKVDRWGFKIRAPKGWTKAVMSAQEKWIAAKFIGKKGLQPKGKNEFYVNEKPDMWVIAFPADRERLRTAKRDKKTKRVKIDDPYRDYKDFLKREKWAASGGFYFSKEEETTVKGIKVSVYEVKVEKSVNAPKRLIAWMFHFPTVEFAIQFRVLEDHVDDYRSTFEACFRSIAVTGPAKALAVTTGKAIEDEGKSEDDMTPEERRRHRAEEVNRLLRSEIAALEKPWYSMESEHYVALTNTDKKFVKRTLDHAEALRKYLDETFPDLGSDFVPRGVLRIFNSRDEERAFQSGTASVWAAKVEQVLVSKAVGEEKDWEHEYMGRRITRQWISFRNKELYRLMPYWIRQGLVQHMAFAKPKGRRIAFKPDPYDADSLRKLIKGEKSIPLVKLLTGDDDAFKEHAHNLQAGSVVGWMLGKGNRGKLKGAVEKYLVQLVGIVDEETEAFEKKQKERKAILLGKREKKEGEEGGDDAEEEGLSDEEEERLGEEFERMWKEFSDALKERSKSIRKRAFEAAFGQLKDRDWKKLDNAWKKFAG